jgi:hypothetical protein
MLRPFELFDVYVQVKAFEESQKYKEGKFILEKERIVRGSVDPAANV